MFRKSGQYANSIKNSDSHKKYSFIESANVILLPGSPPKTNRPTRKTLKSERDNWQHSRGTTFWYNTWLESSSSSSSVEEEKKTASKCYRFYSLWSRTAGRAAGRKGSTDNWEHIMTPFTQPPLDLLQQRYDIASHTNGGGEIYDPNQNSPESGRRKNIVYWDQAGFFGVPRSFNGTIRYYMQVLVFSLGFWAAAALVAAEGFLCHFICPKRQPISCEEMSHKKKQIQTMPLQANRNDPKREIL